MKKFSTTYDLQLTTHNSQLTTHGLQTNFVGLKLKNPVFLASGVGGVCGEEYSEIIDLNRLGGYITKTITLNPRKGNPPPRIVETPSGTINRIGLENPGLEEFVGKKLLVIRKLFKIPVIVSIGGESSSEFTEIVKKLNRQSGISGYELNLSCPNIKESGKAGDGPQTWSGLISQDTELTYEIVSAVRKNTKLPIIAKLSPAVSDITKVASICKDAGADAVSLINSYPAMYFTSQMVNTHWLCSLSSLRARLWRAWQSNKGRLLRRYAPRNDIMSEYSSQMLTVNCQPIFGGLSGQAIKPIALRMVYEVARQVKIPIMGVGGIVSVEDAIEFFSAGASTIAIGSGIFKDPELPLKIISQLRKKIKTQENLVTTETRRHGERLED